MKIILRSLIHWSWLLILCLLAGWFVGKALATLLPPNYQATAAIELNGQSRSSQIIQPVAAYAALVTSDPVLNPVLKKYPQLDRTTFVSKQLAVNNVNSAQDITIQVTYPNAKIAAVVANMLAQMLVEQQNAEIKAQYTKEVQIDTNQVNSDQQKIDLLNQQYVKASQASPPDTALLQQLNSQISQEQNLQSQDINQRQALLTEQALSSNPLSVVQSAAVPTKPSSIVGQIPMTPVALLVMLILGVALVILLETSAKRINGASLIQQHIGVPVLGSLSWTNPSPQRVELSTICESQDRYAGECRVMMADVLFHAEEAHAHILAVTSIRSRSGNSCIASQLAALLAQSKRRVLLIDANLYEPAQHIRLSVSNEAGLAKMLEDVYQMKTIVTSTMNQDRHSEDINLESGTDKNIVKGALFHPAIKMNTKDVASMQTIMSAAVVLPSPASVQNLNNQNMNGKNTQKKGYALDQRAWAVSSQGAVPEIRNGTNRVSSHITDKSPFENYILSTSIQNLYVLPAGQPNLNPSSLLSMPEMVQFLRWASMQVAFIVIDCPSLVYAEAHVLGSLSDQTLLVVDATKDRLKKVQNTKEELLNTGVKLSGIILNKLGKWV